MEIKYENINNLKPYEKNPRKNDEAVDFVAESIKEFGFKVPIIVDENNVIVAGHTRYKASKKLGIEQVPVIVADDLSEAQIKAFRLADNKTAEKAEWDFDLLYEELDEILDIDMSEFGFLENNESYIDDLMENDFRDLKEELGVFQVTFVFDKAYEKSVNGYIKEFGKEKLANVILKECGEVVETEE